MEGLSYDYLPVIVVSAKDNVAASSIISEIIDNESTEFYKENGDLAEKDRVWRIVNKYYTADVRLHPVVDDEESSSEENSAEAHIIYLTEEEAATPAAADAVQRRAAAAPSADTRLVVVAGDGRARHAALPAAAARAAAELVALAAAADDDDDDGGGVGRVRSALQARAWRGRRRAEGGAARGSAERCEVFAAALGALPAAARLARSEPAADRELRLERAEALVAAFCRALGEDPDHW